MPRKEGKKIIKRLLKYRRSKRKNPSLHPAKRQIFKSMR